MSGVYVIYNVKITINMSLHEIHFILHISGIIKKRNYSKHNQFVKIIYLKTHFLH